MPLLAPLFILVLTPFVTSASSMPQLDNTTTSQADLHVALTAYAWGVRWRFSFIVGPNSTGTWALTLTPSVNVSLSPFRPRLHHLDLLQQGTENCIRDALCLALGHILAVCALLTPLFDLLETIGKLKIGRNE